MVYLTAAILTEIKSLLKSQYDIEGEFVFAGNSEKGIVAVLLEDENHPQFETPIQIAHLIIYNGKNLKLNDRAHLPENIADMVSLAKSLT